MSNPAKQKGTAAETAVVNFLRANGFPAAERRALSGVADRGDIAGIPGVVIEVKDQATMALGTWMNEVYRETAGHVLALGVVWHHRPRKSNPGEWYVTMDGWTFLQFLKEWSR